MLSYPRREDHKLHEDYEELKCCAVCRHVFEWYEYDSQPFYYCHRDGSKRPLCQSVAMGEVVDWYNNRAGSANANAAWDKWASKRQVEPYGWCPSYRECYTEDKE